MIDLILLLIIRGRIMTREEARKAAEVMLAYAEGKEVEYRQRGEEGMAIFLHNSI